MHDQDRFRALSQEYGQLEPVVQAFQAYRQADEDRVAAYELNVAGYIVKSDIGNGFLRVVHMLDHYWKVVVFP